MAKSNIRFNEYNISKYIITIIEKQYINFQLSFFFGLNPESYFMLWILESADSLYR